MECEDQLTMVIGQTGSGHRWTGSLDLREHSSHRKERKGHLKRRDAGGER